MGNKHGKGRWCKWFLALLMLAGTAEAHALCGSYAWTEPARGCYVSYTACPDGATPFQYRFEVDCPAADLTIRLKTGVPQRCWDQAAMKWGCYVEYARGLRAGVAGCPRFPHDGCGKWVYP